MTFDRISRHFRSIRNFFFFHIFDRISQHFISICNFFFEFVSQNGRRRPFWITKNHFRAHFSPFQINTLLFCKNWRPKITFNRISRHFRSIRNFFFGGGGILFTKWPQHDSRLYLNLDFEEVNGETESLSVFSYEMTHFFPFIQG